MGSRLTWPYMKRDIINWVKDCQECSHAKVTRQPAAVVQPIPVPIQHFSHIHVDFVGPLTVSKEGYRYLFTIIDRSSRWLEAIPWPPWTPTPAWRPSSVAGWPGSASPP